MNEQTKKKERKIYIKTEEHRKHLSESRKGIKFSESHLKALSESHKGKTFKHSEETKRKIRESNLGKKRSQETKDKLKVTRSRQIIKPLPIETRRRMSLERKGDKCYAWKGGITKINLSIRNSFEYRLWREAVFKRDSYTCVWCGKRGGKLNADHIKPFCNYPELRFSIDNGRTLCIECHKTTETYGPKARNK